MENLNLQSTVSSKVSHLVEQISSTCNALLSALEVNAHSVGTYGGGILQQFDSEFVDRVVKNLLKIKYHTARLAKELNKGLIRSPEELTVLISGLLQTIDQLDILMLEDGFMRNQFSFFIDELKGGIRQILEEINIF
ncbi:MAG: hypothetical protein LBD75_07810 [Candidatus Peribacteria bacterium]|jgi:hypothetical protein|nr:hypothetical protein [Candidatus Peribacteria bacterium]